MSASFGNDDGGTFHINLAPMLDIIVSIIPMLLLSVVFVQMASIDTPVAAAGTKSSSQTPEQKAKLYVTGDRSVEIQVEGAAKVTIPAKAGAVDWMALASALQKNREQNPKVARLELLPAKELPIQTVVEIMDHVQGTGEGKYEAVGFGNLTGDVK